MAIKENIFPLTIMSLILLFSLIHLGVSIGIIGQYRKYSSFFGPQIGLAGYNLAISIFGLAAGIVGLFAFMTDSPKIGKVFPILEWTTIYAYDSQILLQYVRLSRIQKVA